MLTTELNDLIKRMQEDVDVLERRTNKAHMSVYEEGYSDGALETMKASVSLIKIILLKAQKEETDPSIGAWDDVPPTRTGMGG